jgi:hypothetical protein
VWNPDFSCCLYVFYKSNFFAKIKQNYSKRYNQLFLMYAVEQLDSAWMNSQTRVEGRALGGVSHSRTQNADVCLSVSRIDMGTGAKCMPCLS